MPHKGWRKSDLYTAYGTIDFLPGGIDNNGNLHLYMFDTYDFNKRGQNSIDNPAIQAGRNQMMKGNLKGYFSLHEIILTSKDMENIWKEKK